MALKAVACRNEYINYDNLRALRTRIHTKKLNQQLLQSTF